MRAGAFAVLSGVMCVGASSAVAGIPVFANGDGIAGQYFASAVERELFQIQITGGGVLESITIAPNHVDFFGGATPRSESGFVYIYADQGGTPDGNGDLQPDQLVFEAPFTTSVLAGNTSERLTIDALAAGVTLATDATLWIGLEFDGSFRTLVSFEEVGNIPDTGLLFERGAGFVFSDIGGFDEGDQVPIFDLVVVPAPGALVLAGVSSLLATRRRR